MIKAFPIKRSLSEIRKRNRKNREDRYTNILMERKREKDREGKEKRKRS